MKPHKNTILIIVFLLIILIVAFYSIWFFWRGVCSASGGGIEGNTFINNQINAGVGIYMENNGGNVFCNTSFNFGGLIISFSFVLISISVIINWIINLYKQSSQK
ncbi:MAG TPA: hypothetical protein VI815_04265 [Candidatus Nanoarchaeia archaeon]|nr:hypothetical protein [Candidatus Nanoarchaeia archaeon]